MIIRFPFSFGFFAFCTLALLALTVSVTFHERSVEAADVPVVHKVDGANTSRIQVIPGEHYIIRTPAEIRIKADTAFGDPLVRSRAAFYWYRYSDHEAENVRAGKRGQEIFDGSYTLSHAFYRSTIVENRSVHVASSVLAPSSYYYLWMEPIAGEAMPFFIGWTDTDGDGWTDAAEDLNGNGLRDANETDPVTSDTDGDMVSDGTERMFAQPVPGDASAPLLDPLVADPAAASLLSAWMLTRTLCVPNAEADNEDPFFDVSKVRIDAGCLPPVSVRCSEGVCGEE